MEETSGHNSKQNKPVTKRPHFLRSLVRLRKGDGGYQGPGKRGEEESYYLMGTEFQFGKTKENAEVDGGGDCTTM